MATTLKQEEFLRARVAGIKRASFCHRVQIVLGAVGNQQRDLSEAFIEVRFRAEADQRICKIERGSHTITGCLDQLSINVLTANRIQRVDLERVNSLGLSAFSQA